MKFHHIVNPWRSAAHGSISQAICPCVILALLTSNATLSDVDYKILQNQSRTEYRFTIRSLQCLSNEMLFESNVNMFCFNTRKNILLLVLWNKFANCCKVSHEPSVCRVLEVPIVCFWCLRTKLHYKLTFLQDWRLGNLEKSEKTSFVNIKNPTGCLKSSKYQYLVPKEVFVFCNSKIFFCYYQKIHSFAISSWTVLI